MKKPEIKTSNCLIAAALIVCVFHIGRCSKGEKYNHAPDKYIRKGDFVERVEGEGRVNEDETFFNAPNGSPKVGEKVRVLDINCRGEGLVLEGYPTYYRNKQTGWSIGNFRKVNQ